MNSIFRKPIFWISFIVFSGACLAYAFKFFSLAFPIIDITITMDRDQALTQAKNLSTMHNWGPATYDTAISFDTDSQTQTFIELEGGGPDAFKQMIAQHLYEPYLWHVRLFKEFDANETHIYFTPDGKLYGFQEIIADDIALPSLKKSQALELVRNTLTTDWHINLDAYELVEASKKVQLNERAHERIDRTFVFERTNQRLQEGTYRIKTMISGNKLTQVKHLVKIPESFNLKYRQMRSYNDAIASAGSIFAYLVYLLFGCIIGLFILLRINWVVWRQPLIAAGIIAGSEFLLTFNSFPLLLMQYQTENSLYGFLLQAITQALQLFFFQFIIMALVFTTAESLTRRAFGNQVQLWRSWAPGIGNSYTIFGQTIGGYLVVGIHLAFLVTFYLITTRMLGWWTPLSQMADPNVLASYLPWLSSVVLSLGAGFLEECKFRAIPFASAALLGERFGKKNWWIGAAFIVQALVFSAAHANYPAQPAYARLVELLVPSFIFAGIYLRFGLLPSIISHYTYDVILFALPIFFAQTPLAWLNKLIVITCIAIPLLIILYRYLQHGITEIKPGSLNKEFIPKASISSLGEKTEIISIGLSQHKRLMYAGLGLLGLLAWVFATPFKADSPALNIFRQDAIASAQEGFNQLNLPINTAIYQPYAQLRANYTHNPKSELQHRYLWQTYDAQTYHTLFGTFIKPPHWFVRFLRFDGSLLERAQEFEATIGAQTHAAPSYGMLSWKHKLPEQIPGATLEKKEARAVAQQFLQDQGYNIDDFYELKAKPQQHPERKDWTFTFAKKDNTTAKNGELNLIITVGGDRVTAFEQKVQVPQTFKRADRNRQTIEKSVQSLCQLFVWLLFFVGMLCGLLYWAKGLLSLRWLIGSWLGYAMVYALMLINNWPHLIAQFNTQAPFANQLLNTYGSLIARYLVRATVVAFGLSFIVSYRPRYRYSKTVYTLLTGIAAGLLLRGAWACITLLKPSVEPLWGNYTSLASQLPMLAFITDYLIIFLLYVSAFTLCGLALDRLTDYGTKNKISVALACIGMSLITLGMLSLPSIGFWLLSGILFGIIVLGVWYYMLRLCPATIPVMITTCCVLSILQQMLFNLTPHVWISGIVTCILLAVLTLWYVYYAKQQHHIN